MNRNRLVKATVARACRWWCPGSARGWYERACPLYLDAADSCGLLGSGDFVRRLARSNDDGEFRGAFGELIACYFFKSELRFHISRGSHLDLEVVLPNQERAFVEVKTPWPEVLNTKIQIVMLDAAIEDVVKKTNRRTQSAKHQVKSKDSVILLALVFPPKAARELQDSLVRVFVGTENILCDLRTGAVSHTYAADGRFTRSGKGGLRECSGALGLLERAWLPGTKFGAYFVHNPYSARPLRPGMWRPVPELEFDEAHNWWWSDAPQKRWAPQQ